jgi:competence protein ComEC
LWEKALVYFTLIKLLMNMYKAAIMNYFKKVIKCLNGIYKKIDKIVPTNLLSIVFYRFPIFIKNSFFEDRESWVLWAPVLFGIGSITYIYFPYFSYLIFSLYIITYSLLFFLLRKKQGWLILLFACLLLDSGYLLMGLREHRLKSHRIVSYMGKVEIVGKITEFLPYEKKDEIKERIIVDIVSIQKLEKPFIKIEVWKNNEMTPYFDENGIMHNIPKKIRINLKNNDKSVKVGDVVKLEANLIPLPKKVYPNSYDFEKYAYFKQIGGIGNNGNVIEIIEGFKPGFVSNLNNKLSNYRNSLAKDTFTKLNYPSSGILSAFLTGIKAYIKHSDLENLRASGIAHIITVSGLHMFALVGLVMFFSRKLFVKIEYLALNFNTKKWAAMLSLICGFAYLAMVGFPVSAQRAYIMIALVLLAIILDKETYSLRSIAFACLAILIFRPELIANVGFQMSFMAVLGLISVFRFLKESGVKLFTANKFLKPFYYVAGSLLASIIATVCVMPFSIYYFNVFSTYNILANLFAIPLIVFYIMPLVLFSFILTPLGLEKLTLIPASWGANLMMRIAEKIASMPNAIYIVASPSRLSMGLMIGGALWLLLWNKTWRWLGAPIIFIGIMLAFRTPLPDLIVDYRSKIFAITDGEGKLYFSHKPNEYKKNIWMKKIGEKTFRLIDDYPYKDFGIVQHAVDKKGISISKDLFIQAMQGRDETNKPLQCNEDYCLMKVNGELIYIVKTLKGIKPACTFGDRVVNLSPKKIWYCKDMDNVYQREWDGEEVEVFRFRRN